MTVHIGTSGWDYDHWRNVLYADRDAPRTRLSQYTAQFETVELNASFYRWPRDSGFASWRHRLPPGFVMSAKAPRGLTHGKRLYSPDVWIDRIVAGWHELGDRRGALLVQLPPDLGRDDDRLEYFLARVPSWIKVAVELRHRSWDDDAVYSLLERHGAAYCVMSGAGLPCVLRATAPFVYVRLHGPDR
ncbi:MAG: sensor histidine kinase, partial [Jatrophihabitantaceae bacterium]|nr:sensor histidine kinase [Jatrophihabitantaceae bacterium]